ncbi:hypothetical protein [Planomicrobium okeanokoites]|uniref:hypothetical protein n=1 Tax=Planomicrobium okeanokoites TaxID=244 RepID=UPI0030F8C5E0
MTKLSVECVDCDAKMEVEYLDQILTEDDIIKDGILDRCESCNHGNTNIEELTQNAEGFYARISIDWTKEEEEWNYNEISNGIKTNDRGAYIDQEQFEELDENEKKEVEASFHTCSVCGVYYEKYTGMCRHTGYGTDYVCKDCRN